MSISIHNLCHQKGVSLPSLAERSGVDLTRLQAIYLGRWTPSAIQRAKIAQALDTPKADITWQHSTPVAEVPLPRETMLPTDIKR